MNVKTKLVSSLYLAACWTICWLTTNKHALDDKCTGAPLCHQLSASVWQQLEDRLPDNDKNGVSCITLLVYRLLSGDQLCCPGYCRATAGLLQATRATAIHIFNQCGYDDAAVKQR